MPAAGVVVVMLPKAPSWMQPRSCRVGRTWTGKKMAAVVTINNNLTIVDNY